MHVRGEVCTGVHGGAWRCMGQIQQDPRGMHALHFDGYPCPLQQSCMAMHGEHMEAQPPMGLKGGSGDGNCDHIRF